jgi:hypothetical protein
MDQAAAKQQVVERIKQANNILVTVANNPSVDQLAACIGMTLFLNKLEKHATAVYSGKTPPAIEFLQPEKTLEPNTDSLRDFIISLDKAKADKLRYKVEDKFVRIYITPYRTSISEKDLVFSEGDFNVEVVLALGVRDKAQLDAAITKHGRILHDATVISVNFGEQKAPNIGQINWQESSSSSLCEMLVSISEAFGTGLIDNQMATAFLTGIVAETERFSNPKTSPKVMTMAAQLMAAGANQQLIVSKLEPPEPPPEADKPVKPPKPPKEPPPDTLKIPHEETKKKPPEVEIVPGEIKIDAEGNIVEPKGQKPQQLSSQKTPDLPAVMSYESLKSEPVTLPPETKPPESPHTKPMANLLEPIDKQEQIDAKPPSKPHAILDPHENKPSIPPFTADTEPGTYNSENSVPVDPLSESYLEPDRSTPAFQAPTEESARSAVDAALAAAPFNPGSEEPVKSLNASPLPTQPDTQKQAGPAPPPVPPPLRLDSGNLIPTAANGNKTSNRSLH